MVPERGGLQFGQQPVQVEQDVLFKLLQLPGLHQMHGQLHQLAQVVRVVEEQWLWSHQPIASQLILGAWINVDLGITCI